MSLNKKHFLPNKSEREYKYFHPIYKMGGHSLKEFQRIEDLLDDSTCDLINGLSKSEILLKFQNGMYEDQHGKGVSLNTAEEYYKAILSRLSLDRDRDVEQVKDALYSQYLNIYREAMESGNLMMAKSTLDSLVKLYGIDKQPENAIQINSTGSVDIKFGFKTDESDS